MKKIASLILILVLLSSMLAGCGLKTEAPAVPADQIAEPSASPQVNYKPEIIIGISGKIVSLDPQENTNAQHNYIFRVVFDTLLDYDNQTRTLRPNLAVDWQSDDALTWTFQLRDDVVFHNGKKMKASDVAYTFFTAGLDSSASASFCKSLAKVAFDDDANTVTITLHEPNVDFPYQLTLPTASILSKETLEEDPENGALIGTGPFMIDSYEFGDYVKLKRNDQFWGELPKTQYLNFRYMPDNSARLIALQAGDIDVCQSPDASEQDHITADEKLQLQGYDSCSIQYLAMNTQSGVFQDENTRLAICYAIDRQELIDVTYEGQGNICQSTWGWNTFGYNGSGAYAYPCDPQLAQKYLQLATATKIPSPAISQSALPSTRPLPRSFRHS